MKKKTKKMCKVLSVFLAFLIVAQILPLQVLAENITDAIAHQQFINDVVNNPTSEDDTSDAEILYEVEEKRDEYTKVYKKSDGTYTAIMTEEPLHYLYNGEWEEINNSMSLNGNLYTNLDNLFNVEFPESIDSNENLTVEKDGYELSFSVDEIEESSAVVENDIVVSDTNIPVADEAIAQTQSSVTYNDVAENTDLQYIVTPNSIKENIIVASRESVKDTYTFTFETNGLDAEKLDDGSVVFKDDNDDVKFRIPRPVMTDAGLSFSYDIDVVLIENTDDTITLEYSPSSEWTNSLERAYPITIDPAIAVENKDVLWVEDTWVAFDSSNSEFQNNNGYNDCAGAVVNTTSIDSNGNIVLKKSEIYTKFNIDALKSLGDNIVFTEVQYLFVGASADGKALAKNIKEFPTIENGIINLSNVTYNTKPTLDDEVIDYYTSPYSLENDGSADFSYIHFNITKPLNEWYNGAENNGFAVVSGNEEYIGLFVLNGVATSSSDTNTYTTAIVMDYVEVGGYNENLNYHSQTVGRAGTGYVNDFTQQLSVIRDDINIANNNFPVTIGMIYDSASYDKLEQLNYENMMAYGNNWLPNYLRAYLTDDNNNYTYYTSTGTTIDFTRSIDDDGNVIFTELYSDIYGNHGYELEYHPALNGNKAYYTVNRPDGYIEKFNNDGLLTSVTKLVYTNQPEDNSSEQSIPICTEQSIIIEYDDLYRIDYIADFTGYVYDYVYFNDINENDKNLLSKITYYTSSNDNTSPLEIIYTYDENNNLIKVTFPDEKSVEYAYENGNMKSMTNIDNYRITYGYEENVCINDIGEETIEYTNRVTNVVEQAKSETTYVNGNSITYERLNSNQVKLTDATGDYEIYHFGAFGNLLYRIDNNGNYVMHEDVDSTDETHFASVSDYREFSSNLLSNSSFEEINPIDGSLKNWETSKTTNMQSNEKHALFGTKVLKISSNENESVNIKQSVNVISGGKYTFSAYVYATKENSHPLTLKLYHDDMAQDCVTTSVTTTNGKWERYTVTLNAPADIEEITVELTTADGGTFYIDGVQLEQSTSASLYNYIQNGGFNNDLNHWTTSTNLNFEESTINGKTVNALILPGEENEIVEISQTVAIDGKRNDIIRVGGWFKGNYIKSLTNNVWLKNIDEESGNPNICNFTKDREAYIEVKCVNTNTNDTQIIQIPFNENLDDWQFIAREFSLDGIYDQATITVYYSKNLNSALLSNIELTKTKVRTTTYDSGEKPCPCVDCTVIDCPCNCEWNDICYCTQCMPEDESTNRDSFGTISLGNNYDEIVTSQLLSQRIGDNVTVNYNLSNGLYKAYVDAQKTFTSYTYNNSGVLTNISANGNIINFTYENDRITTIEQNDTTYKFNYDSWGQITQISIGDTPIVSYQYDSEEYRDRIIKVTYHNDDSTNSITTFSYNDESNSLTISVNDTEKFICIFDKKGSLVEIQEKNGRKINYINDKIEISKGETKPIYMFDIDTEGNYVETFGGTSFTTNLFGLYNSDCTYRDLNAVSTNNENFLVAEAWFDAVGRYSPNSNSKIYVKGTTKAEINNCYIYDDTDMEYNENDIFSQFLKFNIEGIIEQLKITENSTYSIMYTYVNGPTASLKDFYFFACKYDVNHNVTYELIRDFYGRTYYECDYVYDNNNQLKRINHISYNVPSNDNYNSIPIISAENSVTYTYEYDVAGNLRYKREYEYTTDEDLKEHKPINVIAYGYNSDNEWKDQLMSYGSTSINYDGIGNPISIGDKQQLTWNGKQLKTYTDGDKVINYEYDVNGLCCRKIVTNDSNVETYDYIWSDGKLAGQIYTDSESNKYAIKFIYDLFNSPYGFIISKDNTEQMYLYLKNFKGDIIGVVNEEGHIVISYEYDAWGVLTNPQQCIDANFKDVISKLPITYRGYFYDYDTGLYYIQGRYYNPEIGRFINADSTSNLGSTGTALSYNLYAYCENNPIMYVVDNKNTAFSNTINANYLYNKRISQGLTGFIDDQQDGIASKLRYGRNTIAPFGCGTVATYNALIMLGNRIEICDIIRNYEMNHIYHYGLIGTHGNNIARFFSEKGYDVTITNLEDYNFTNDKDLSTVSNIVKKNPANILYYKSSGVGHFIAIKYIGQDSNDEAVYVTYNENTNNGVSNSIKDFIPGSNQPYMLISISNK